LKKQIEDIRKICREKEEKFKQRKDALNLAKQEENRCSSSHSYTISNPFFPVSQLPEANELSSDRTESSDKDTIIDGSLTLQSEILDEELQQQEEEEHNTSEKESKNAQNSIDKRLNESIKQPQVNRQQFQLKDLIDKQKEEYVLAMDLLKRKFASEQHSLLAQLQSQMQNLTSTPMTNTSMVSNELTEDEEFAEFKQDLHSNSAGEKTLVNETDRKITNAATVINAYVRGYLVRRLMKTSLVQERVKNILETVQYIRNIEKHRSGSPILKNNILKKKLFMYLQGDLYRVYEIFIHYSTKEKMRMIAADRDSLQKTVYERNMDYLNCSVQTI
jgi:hypothetical protein